MFSALRTSSVKCAVRTNFSVSVNAIKPGNKISLPLAKIVATIGPASENLDVLPHVVDAGLRIMRINFSHATYEEADLRVKNIKKCRGINATDNAVDGQLNTRSIMLDTQGPEIRTGSFANGVKDIDVVAGDKITLTTDEAFRANQSKDVLWISYRKLYDTLHTGSSILLDDGVIEVTVDSKSKNDKGEANIICTIVNSGNLGNKKGVNMPGLKVDLPAMSEKDKQDIRWGIANDIDYIAASFTRKPSDVEEIRSYAAGLLKELYPTTYAKHAIPRIISKIESTEALDNFDEILAVSDGIMVARGDLAVEIPMESLACVSKEIVRKSALAGKPVIVATQMLESMQKNPRPTRAECTDVANALLDGADAVMLSGESAKGKYPVGAVSMMNRIVQHTEHVHKFTDKLLLPTTTTPRGVFGSLEATAYGAVQAVNASQDVKYVVINLNDSEARLNNVFNERTTTENLTNFISKHRPQVPVLVVVPDHKTGRLLQFYRGVHPIVLSNANGRICDHKIATHLTKLNLVSKNDQIALLSKHDGVVSLSFNTIAH